MEKYELVNPERCMMCGKFARWDVVVNDTSLYLCDNCLEDYECDVTLSDASRKTGRAYHILYSAYRRGELAAKKIGRDLWVSLEDVQALPVRGRGKPRRQVVTDVIPNK